MWLLAVLGLSSWRISSLVLHESGPKNVFGWSRTQLHVEDPGPIEPGSLRELFSCLWCISVWISIVLYAGVMVIPRIVVPVLWVLSASAVAIALDKHVTRV